MASDDDATHAYARFYARHVWNTATQVPEPCPSGAEWAWWGAWTPEERAVFFHALGVHSRQRPDLVARDVGTRSVVEVCMAIKQFDRMLHETKRLERKMFTRTQRRRRMLERIPAARQVPDDVLAWEETQAEKLAKTGLETVSVQSLEKLEYVAEYLRKRAQGGHESVSDAVSRLIHLPGTLSVDAQVSMIPEYEAYTQKSPAPRITSTNEARTLMQLLCEHNYISINGAPDSAVIEWHNDRCAQATLPEHLVDLVNRDVLATHTDLQISSETMVTLTRLVLEFVTRVVFELVTVGERSHSQAGIDASFVWTTLARLGCVGGEAWNADLLASVARRRAVSDPPVAWTMPDSSPDMLDDESSETDVTGSDSSVMSDVSYEAEDEAPYEMAPIGSDAPLVPTEVSEHAAWVPINDVIDSDSESVDGTQLDAHIDALDEADAARYVMRLRRDFMSTSVRNAESEVPSEAPR